MKFHNIFILLIFSLAFTFNAAASPQAKPNYASASHLPSLSQAHSSSDSLRIMLDLYEQSDDTRREEMRNQIISLTANQSNQEIISDAINNLATTTDDASQLKRLIEISDNLSDKNDRDALQTILIMESAKAEAENIQDSELQQHILEYSRHGSDFYGNSYQEIQNIYKVMTYLGANSQGPLYLEYIKRLEQLVDNLPEKDHGIKNLFYTTAAIFYTRKRDYESAIKSDRKLIDELDAIKQSYLEKGKSVQDLDYFYYVSYRRMLRNFRGLPPEEIEQIYQKCLELAEINPQVKEEFENGALTNSYYYFATKKFAEAIPFLEKALDNPDISNFRRMELLGLIAYAYNQTGNDKKELEALREYTLMQVADRNVRRDDMYREIEIRNSINDALAQEALQQERIHQQNRVMRQTSITLVYVLGIILIFVIAAYFRLRGQVKDLKLKNKSLHRNIEYIFDDGSPKGTRDLRDKKHKLKG